MPSTNLSKVLFKMSTARASTDEGFVQANNYIEKFYIYGEAKLRANYYDHSWPLLKSFYTQEVFVYTMCCLMRLSQAVLFQEFGPDG